MTLEDAIKTLTDLKRQDPVIQRSRSAELVTNFKIFWDSGPTEEQFVKLTDSLLFTSRMIFYMIEHPIWARKETIAETIIQAPPPVPAAAQSKGGKHR